MALARPRRGARASLLVLAVVAPVLAGFGGRAEPVRAAGAAENPRALAGSTPVIVWAAVEEAGTLVKVDARARKVLRRFRPGGGPHNITVGSDGTVAASLYASDGVAIVHAGRLRVVRLGGRPHDVKIRGDRIVVANEGANRLEILSTNGRRLGRVGLVAPPHDLALQPGHNRAWVSLDGDGRLAIVNLGTKRVRYVQTGHRPHDLLFAPDGRLFVTDWTGRLLVVSPPGKVTAIRKLGREAHHLAFTPDGRQVWITDHALHRLFVLGTRSLKVVSSILIRGAPHHVTISPDGRLALVANHSRGRLVVFSVATRHRIGGIDVGPGPHGVWAAP